VLSQSCKVLETLSAPVAPSTRILGNTLAGYGLVAINLAYVLGFYLFTSKHLGWWNPAGLQVDPNFIAMPLPWLSVLSMALHAGFWEEALFRENVFELIHKATGGFLGASIISVTPV